jgi:hypothetical protein
MTAQVTDARMLDFYYLKAWRRILDRTMVTDQCWIFLGAQSGKGYGCASIGGQSKSAHRISYEVNNGPIPAGMTVDHTCHDPAVCVGGKCVHRLCVNPEHLSIETTEDNSARQTPAAATHCGHGHLYTDLTTGYSSGRRYCKACRSERSAEAARVRPERHARSRAIREWASANGIPVTRRGRISEAVIAAWVAAGHPGWPTP